MNNEKKRSDSESIKKAIIISSIMLVVIVGLFAGIIGIKSYNSKNVSKKVVKEDIIGTGISVGNIKIEITSDNLDEVEILDKENETDLGTRMCTYNGIVKIKDENYEANIPFESSYVYIGGNRKWELWSVDLDKNDDNFELVIKTEATDDVIKKAFVGETISGIEITDSISKTITLTKKEDDGEGTVEIEAEFYDTSKNPKQKITIEADVEFNGEKWAIYDCYSKREKNTVTASSSLGSSSNSSSSTSITSNNNNSYTNSYTTKSLKETYLEKYNKLAEELSTLERSYSNSLTETEKKELANKKYSKWDGFLNEIWTTLMENMESSEFEALTQVQISWITEKESIAKNKGGSLDSLEGLKSLSESTKSRCYTLINNYME